MAEKNTPALRATRKPEVQLDLFNDTPDASEVPDDHYEDAALKPDHLMCGQKFIIAGNPWAADE